MREEKRGNGVGAKQGRSVSCDVAGVSLGEPHVAIDVCPNRQPASTRADHHLQPHRPCCTTLTYELMQPSFDAGEAHNATAMAADGDERRDNDTSTAEARDTQHDSQTNGRAEHSDDDDEEEDEDEERHFKYASLTGRLGSVFRRGDSASASLTSGDKLVCSCCRS